MEKRCTVCVANAEGRRHSPDLQTESTFDAAHCFVTSAKAHPESGLPRATLATAFKVVIDGKVFKVEGAAPQRSIER